ncbi:N-acetylglucosamine-6-phosphate deacetylase [Ningiella sp. W23]|uniref:N-acetylglucosamine-6-phosphate deacetylase n=1 Tax=Ningiella sp. W23 TaxID=3023715 RepID=UPI0037575D4F
MKIFAKTLFHPEQWLTNQVICVQDQHILSISDAQEIDYAKCDETHDIIIPGFIDIQVNGGGNALFNDKPDIECLTQIFAAHQQYGTVGMLPTLITDDFNKMARAADAVAKAINTEHAGVLGIHFEGPWLSAARKGVHEARFIRPPSDREIALLERNDIGKVMVTLAPETVPASLITQMRELGILVFLGHSNATLEQVNEALDAGAIGFTHLFNAMSQMQSRAPGMVGAALASDASFAGIIVDGHHVDPSCCKAAFLAKTREKLMLVTDAMALAASEKMRMDFFDTHIIRSGNKLSTPDGTLAGSCLTMIDAVKNMHELCGVSLHDSVYMASHTPSILLGLPNNEIGLQSGAPATFISIDKTCSIQQLWNRGQPIKPL